MFSPSCLLFALFLSFAPLFRFFFSFTFFLFPALLPLFPFSCSPRLFPLPSFFSAHFPFFPFSPLIFPLRPFARFFSPLLSPPIFSVPFSPPISPLRSFPRCTLSRLSSITPLAVFAFSSFNFSSLFLQAPPASFRLHTLHLIFSFPHFSPLCYSYLPCFPVLIFFPSIALYDRPIIKCPPRRILPTSGKPFPHHNPFPCYNTVLRYIPKFPDHLFPDFFAARLWLAFL